MNREYSSPACSMHEGGDVELLETLQVLLEAEHAGARVCLESARAAGEDALAPLLRAIHRDEVRWCGMLSSQIRHLGAEPTTTVGAFYSKAMAIADLGERIAFLNRGQGWVVRKLSELLPRVRDESLRVDLQLMLESHQTNVARVDADLGSKPHMP